LLVAFLPPSEAFLVIYHNTPFFTSLRLFVCKILSHSTLLSFPRTLQPRELSWLFRLPSFPQPNRTSSLQTLIRPTKRVLRNPLLDPPVCSPPDPPTCGLDLSNLNRDPRSLLLLSETERGANFKRAPPRCSGRRLLFDVPEILPRLPRGFPLLLLPAT